MIFDDHGLKSSDYAIRDYAQYRLHLTGRERSTVNRQLAAWHRGWRSAIIAAQKQFNLLRRLQESDDDGYCRCCCTGERIHYKEIDAGHYISDRRQATRFDPMNVHPQSKRQNNHNYGDDDAKIAYQRFMNERYGIQAVSDLLAKSEQNFSWRERRGEIVLMRVVWAREIKQEQERINGI